MRLLRQLRENFFIIGLTCLLWYLIRTGTKPSRAVYPCQQSVAYVANHWATLYITPFLGVFNFERYRYRWSTIVVLIILVAGAYGYMNIKVNNSNTLTPMPLIIETVESTDLNPSIIYAVTRTNGNDDGVTRLIELMASRGQPFYLSSLEDKAQGPNGFIGNDDVIIIKVNSQWDERGGTNTDLVKSLIEAIINHPDVWKGEIIIADNGQAQYGGAGKGGSLDWMKNNAQDQTQSMQDVADKYLDYKVSTYLWDTITTNAVQEYAEGDFEDGFVVETHVVVQTGTLVSYPKFTTSYGTKISFKYGLYRAELDEYDSDKLKIINLPVLKSHMIYGVTGAMKHYMGVPSDKLTAGIGYRIHRAVGNGAMGTLMAQTRVPTLNIIDAIYVNAKPKDGPSTSYLDATQVNIIAASTDPIAIDYWASKNILCIVAEKNGETPATMDPDNQVVGEFGNWLTLSMDELNAAGYPYTASPDKISVYVD